MLKVFVTFGIAYIIYKSKYFTKLQSFQLQNKNRTQEEKSSFDLWFVLRVLKLSPQTATESN